MKKLLLFILLLFSFNQTFAKQVIEQLPVNFKPECFEYYTSVPSNTFIKDSSLTISTNKNNVFAKQGNKPIWLLNYKNIDNNINYTSEVTRGKITFGEIKNKDFLNDSNKNTFSELDTGQYDIKDNTIIHISFNDILKAKEFVFDFDYNSKYYVPEFSISKDDKYYSKISIIDIEDFDFKYINIKFKKQNPYNEAYREKIKIYELAFYNNRFIKLLGSSVGDGANVEFYSSYKCKGSFDYGRYKNIEESYDINTEVIKVEFETNPIYNPINSFDWDNDGIIDNEDNCVKIYNSRQLDSNGNGKGDLCSDDDNDGIIGNKDNCIYIKNSNQKDLNRNGVGDVCEFDKDKDGIYDSLDNCINISNPEQKDNDNDGIGNICDNSIYYNPTQLDKNNNGIGDITEEREKHLKENDDDKDGIINYQDNCKNIVNPNQLDTDNDGVGNECDNCKNIQNTNQLDFNKNSIGDICEDSDNDGIEGLTDNCINISNSDQKDTDNDGIGDVCEDDDGDNILLQNDNCPFVYNPEQVDIDKDSIGDKCDDSDGRYIESNSNFFIGLIILITIGFFFGIYMMVRKLK